MTDSARGDSDLWTDEYLRGAVRLARERMVRGWLSEGVVGVDWEFGKAPVEVRRHEAVACLHHALMSFDGMGSG